MRFRRVGAMCALVATLALAACASPVAAETGSSVRPSPTSSATPTPVPSPTPTATAAAVDPADLTTWTITADGIGPLVRGADAAEVVGALTTFEAIEWCTGFMRLQRDATAGIVMSLSEDGARIRTVLVSRGADGASPITEEGIRLGSSTEELTAAYPDLATVGQPGADAWAYAVQADADSWIQFVAEDDVVVLIGVSDRTTVPKEPCT